MLVIIILLSLRGGILVCWSHDLDILNVIHTHLGADALDADQMVYSIMLPLITWTLF